MLRPKCRLLASCAFVAAASAQLRPENRFGGASATQPASAGPGPAFARTGPPAGAPEAATAAVVPGPLYAGTFAALGALEPTIADVWSSLQKSPSEPTEIEAAGGGPAFTESSSTPQLSSVAGLSSWTNKTPTVPDGTPASPPGTPPPGDPLESLESLESRLEDLYNTYFSLDRQGEVDPIETAGASSATNSATQALPMRTSGTSAGGFLANRSSSAIVGDGGAAAAPLAYDDDDAAAEAAAVAVASQATNNSGDIVDLSRLPEGTELHKACPHGFTMVGKECLATETFRANAACPLGTVELAEGCAVLSPAQRTCPAPFAYKQQVDMCVAYETQPAQPICLHGGVYDRSSGMCAIELRSEPICTDGGARNNATGNCERVVDLEHHCEAGFDLAIRANEFTCIRRETAPAMAFCDSASGSSADDQDHSATGPGDGVARLAVDSFGRDVCIRDDIFPPQCAPGYDMVHHFCVRRVPVERAPCPEQSRPSGDDDDTCVSESRSAPFPVCPPNLSPVPGVDGAYSCVESPALEPLLECPPNTVPDDAGACILEVPPTLTCEPGTDLVGLQCRQEAYLVPSPSCPAGLEFAPDNTKCVGQDLLEPQPVCSVGRLSSDGTCLVERSSEAVLVCPPGYQPTKGHTCVKESTYDCSQTVTKIECGPPASLTPYESGSLPIPAPFEAPAKFPWLDADGSYETFSTFENEGSAAGGPGPAAGGPGPTARGPGPAGSGQIFPFSSAGAGAAIGRTGTPASDDFGGGAEASWIFRNPESWDDSSDQLSGDDEDGGAFGFLGFEQLFDFDNFAVDSEDDDEGDGEAVVPSSLRAGDGDSNNSDVAPALPSILRNEVASLATPQRSWTAGLEDLLDMDNYLSSEDESVDYELETLAAAAGAALPNASATFSGDDFVITTQETIVKDSEDDYYEPYETDLVAADASADSALRREPPQAGDSDSPPTEPDARTTANLPRPIATLAPADADSRDIARTSVELPPVQPAEEMEVVRVLRGPGTQRCAKVRRKRHRTCSRSDEVPSAFQCADGGRPNGKECFSELRLPPKQVCHVGAYDASLGMCATEIVRAIVSSCPDGAVMDQVRGHCVGIASSAAKPACPSGEAPVNGVCRLRASRVPSPTPAPVTAPASLACRPGEQRVGAGDQVQCVTRTIARRESACPAGSQPGGGLTECFEIVSPATPPPQQVTVPARFSCAADFALVPGARECVREETAAPTASCPPASFRRADDRCVIIKPPEKPQVEYERYPADWLCSNRERGFELRDNVCVYLAHQAPDLICSPPMTPVPDGFPQKECAKFVEKHFVCPPDARLESPGFCVRRHIVPPTIIQIRICTKGSEDCNLRREKRFAPPALEAAPAAVAEWRRRFAAVAAGGEAGDAARAVGGGDVTIAAGVAPAAGGVAAPAFGAGGVASGSATAATAAGLATVPSAAAAVAGVPTLQ